MTDKKNKFYSDGKRNKSFNDAFNLIAWGRENELKKEDELLIKRILKEDVFI